MDATRTTAVRWTWVAVRTVFFLAFWSLVAVWIVHPEEPSELYRTVLLAAVAAVFAVALWPRMRAALARRVRVRRWFRLVTINAVLLVVFAELGVTDRTQAALWVRDHL